MSGGKKKIDAQKYTRTNTRTKGQATITQPWPFSCLTVAVVGDLVP
jgi:hypothetical protein